MALDKETLRKSMLRDLALLKSLANDEPIKITPTLTSVPEEQLITIANILHYMAEGKMCLFNVKKIFCPTFISGEIPISEAHSKQLHKKKILHFIDAHFGGERMDDLLM